MTHGLHVLQPLYSHYRGQPLLAGTRNSQLLEDFVLRTAASTFELQTTLSAYLHVLRVAAFV